MRTETDIAYIVSHGFAARMVMQTNLLGKLVQNGKSVALICPDKNDPNLKEYCSENKIAIYEFSESGKLSSQKYMFKRKYYLEDMKSNPALWEKHIYSIRYNRSLNPFVHIWPRYYGVIYRLIKLFPSIKTRFIRNEKKMLQSEKAERLLTEINPVKLVATYPVNYSESVLLHYGNKRKSTETWIHLLSWDNISCKGRFPEVADKYIAWGPVMKEEFIEYYGIDESRIYECGVPHFDLHKKMVSLPVDKKSRKDLQLEEGRKVILFGMSSPRFAPNEIEIVEWLAQKAANDEFKHSVCLIVRPHPQNVSGGMKDNSWLNRLKELRTLKNVFVDFPILSDSKLNWSMDKEDMINLSKLINISDITINSGSTFSIDSLMQNKPVILTSFDGDKNYNYWRSSRRLLDYSHLKKLVSFGGISVVNSYPELNDIIETYLSDGNHLSEKRSLTLNRQVRNTVNGTDAVAEILSN